jgi:enoyl-CoA hydratase
VNGVDLPATEVLIAAIARASKALPITLTGGGDAFSASVDTRAFGSNAPAEKAAMIRAITRMTSVILSHPAPVVAAVNGHALGGGFVLVLCDEVEANLMRRLAFTSAVLGTADLSAHGLADQLVAPSDLIGAARRAALETAAQPAFSVVKPQVPSGLIQRAKALAGPGDHPLARFYET